jgi:hypothetical protein
MATNLKKVSIEKIAKEKLPKQIVYKIGLTDVEVWEKTESGLFFKISKKTTEFRLIVRTSTRKVMAWFGGITATIAGVVSIMKWLTPILVGYFSKPPP